MQPGALPRWICSFLRSLRHPACEMWRLPLCLFAVVADLPHPTRRLHSACPSVTLSKQPSHFHLRHPLPTSTYTETLPNSAQNSWEVVCVSRKKGTNFSARRRINDDSVFTSLWSQPAVKSI